MESRVQGFGFGVRIQVLGSRFRAQCTENVERFSRELVRWGYCYQIIEALEAQLPIDGFLSLSPC